jgi:citrate lyase subunit beta/citryl-CoA lyase
MPREYEGMKARSYLYAPGHRPDMLERAFGHGADVVVFDLEDGVPLDLRDEARANVVEALRHRAAWVRIADTADLEAVSGLAAGIRVPKVRAADEVRRVCEHVSVPVICAIESGQGLEAAEKIAGVPGVLTLSLGSRDLTADLGCADTEEDLRPVRERLVAACRAAGRVGPVDSVYYGGDEAGLSAAAQSARRLGFSGKSTLRAEDVVAVNRACDER